MTESFSNLTRTVLVTGGAGFLGQACARRFRDADWRVVGIGHSNWTDEIARAVGYDHWVNGRITSESLKTLTDVCPGLRVVVHCAGNGSVPYSLEAPLEAYERTVGTTAVLLDHLRRHSSSAVVLYPSSAAVYGAAQDRPLSETDAPNPVSPYGFHKLMVETLLAEHAACFSQRAVAVRFFSIYGPGLRKQLLWDASRRLMLGESVQTFYGTGDETRDWIHVNDAASLLLYMAQRSLTLPETTNLEVINGASGIRVTVKEILTMLAAALNSETKIRFNGAIRLGDPRFYHADMGCANAVGWYPSITLSEGLYNYARWISEIE